MYDVCDMAQRAFEMASACGIGGRVLERSVVSSAARIGCYDQVTWLIWKGIHWVAARVEDGGTGAMQNRDEGASRRDYEAQVLEFERVGADRPGRVTWSAVHTRTDIRGSRERATAQI